MFTDPRPTHASTVTSGWPGGPTTMSVVAAGAPLTRTLPLATWVRTDTVTSSATSMLMSPIATRASTTSGADGAAPSQTYTSPNATWALPVPRICGSADSVSTWTYRSPAKSSTLMPSLDMWPPAYPPEANASAGTTSHRERPRNPPMTRPSPHTTAAEPSHCSGCSRPPLISSINAPAAATTIAAPSTARPSGERSRVREWRTRSRLARSGLGQACDAESAADNSASRPRTSRMTPRADGWRRGCHSASVRPASSNTTVPGPVLNSKRLAFSARGTPITNMAPPSTRTICNSRVGPTINASHNPAYTRSPIPPTSARTTKPRRTHSASIASRSATNAATPPTMR